MPVSYTTVRSKRKTLAIQLDAEGQVVVRAPLRLPQKQIEAYVEKGLPWILKKQEALAKAKEKKRVITPLEREEGVKAALQYIPKRVAYYADRMGVTYHRITIREQKTRWGSCSGKGNLNFNWKLMLMPKEVLDYVVVHELAHRKEMNHSPKFWAVVEQELPDYRKRRKQLRNLEKEVL